MVSVVDVFDGSGGVGDMVAPPSLSRVPHPSSPVVVFGFSEVEEGTSSSSLRVGLFLRFKAAGDGLLTTTGQHREGGKTLH